MEKTAALRQNGTDETLSWPLFECCTTNFTRWGCCFYFSASFSWISVCGLAGDFVNCQVTSFGIVLLDRSIDWLIDWLNLSILLISYVTRSTKSFRWYGLADSSYSSFFVRLIKWIFLCLNIQWKKIIVEDFLSTFKTSFRCLLVSFDRSIDQLIDWLVTWIGSRIHWEFDRLIDWLTDELYCKSNFYRTIWWQDWWSFLLCLILKKFLMFKYPFAVVCCSVILEEKFREPFCSVTAN